MTNEEALKIIKSLRFDDDDIAIALLCAINVLEKQIKKTLDVEPVVRCAECKFFNREDSTTDGKCRCDVNKLWQPAYFRPYKRFGDFCSCGAKMDERRARNV